MLQIECCRGTQYMGFTEVAISPGTGRARTLRARTASGEQVFVVVTDSVAKQLDGLKNDRALSTPVRRFWSHGLDTCGPAGTDPRS